jgi:hypothetical protein
MQWWLKVQDGFPTPAYGIHILEVVYHLFVHQLKYYTSPIVISTYVDHQLWF